MTWSTVSLPFGVGPDTKTDPKMLDAPKLTLLQDCIFTNAKRLTKRPGNNTFTKSIVGGGTWSSPTMNKNYRNELVLAATGSNGQRLFSYSPDLDSWQDKGKYLSLGVSKEIIATPGTPDNLITALNSSSATIGSITLYAYDTGISNPYSVQSMVPRGVSFCVLDTASGMQLANQVAITSSNPIRGYSRAAVLGTSTFAVFYITGTTGGTPNLSLNLRIISVSSGGGVTVGSEITIGPCYNGFDASTVQFVSTYDVLTTSVGAFIASADFNNLRIDLYTINTAGSTTHTTTIANTTTIGSISVIGDLTNTNAWIYWIGGGSTLFYSVYSTNNLTQILIATNAQTGLSNIQQITAWNNSSTTQLVYVSSYTQPASSLTLGIFYPVITQQTNSVTATIGSVTSFINGLDIYSKPFQQNGKTYICLINVSQSLSTAFVVDVNDATAICKFLQTSCEGIYGAPGNTVGATYVAPTLIAVRYPGFINQVLLNTSTQFSITCGFVVSLTEQSQASSTNLSVYNPNFTVHAQMGICTISLDFNNIDAYQGLIQQDTLVINGGIISQYDGSYVSELGFNIDPDALSASVGTGGSIGAGSFSIWALYQWSDANGNLHQSAPSLPIVVITTGTGNSITVGAAPITLTQKKNVTMAFYRTLANGTTGYLGSSVTGLFTWDDSQIFAGPDSSAQLQPTLYTEGGAILENIAPPPSLVMWTNNNRLWAVDSENSETLIEYSKTASLGSGISFSTGQLEIQMDSKFGSITLGSGMDEKTVILKQNGAFYFVGDGANDSGSGATFSIPQIVPSDTGCSNSKSGVLYPGGILFRSSNNKGIYLFSRGVQITYFGTDVNAYNNQDIQSAVIVPNKNQIRFLTSSGFSLLYDYVFNQWSAFTNYQGLSADAYQGLYTYVRTDGSLYQEDTSGTYLDNGSSYAPLIQLSWIKAGSIQGFERMRRLMLLGDYQTANNGHGVKVSVAYDFVSTFSAPVSYIFPGTNTVYQYRERVPRQKCDAFQLLIQEIVTGASGEYIDFSDLGLEIAAKTGLNKLPGYASVG